MAQVDDHLRLFLALWPGLTAQARAVTCQAAQPWPAGSRLVAPEDMHVTLHFLGNVPRDRLPDLCTRLDVSPCQVAVTLDRLELWQKSVAVLAAATVPHALRELHGRLAERIWSLGMHVDDRPYRPHITLARQAAGVTFASVHAVRLQAVQYALAASQHGHYPRLCWYGVRAKRASCGP